MAYICDGILLVVIILCVMASAIKGFIGAAKNVFALILTVVLLTTMQAPVVNYLQSSTVGANIKRLVTENVMKGYENGQLDEEVDTTDTEKSLMICEALSLPKFLSSSIETQIKQMSEIKNNVMDVVSDSITMLVMKIIATILLFIVVRLFVFLLLKILESLFQLPGLRLINKTLGAFVGIFNALLMVYIICGLVSLFTPIDKLTIVQDTVNSTYLLKYFYDNNLLFSLFV